MRTLHKEHQCPYSIIICRRCGHKKNWLRPSGSQDKLYKLKNFGVATPSRVTFDLPEWNLKKKKRNARNQKKRETQKKNMLEKTNKNQTKNQKMKKSNQNEKKKKHMNKLFFEEKTKRKTKEKRLPRGTSQDGKKRFF